MKYAVLDFETTGHGPNDRIIQVGLSLIENEQLSQTYSSLVNPEIPIPKFITELTGITDQDVSVAPLIDEVLTEMLPLLNGAILVAHHAAFDVGFLQRMLDECGYEAFQGPVLDTMDVVRIFYPEVPSLQLTMLANSLNIAHTRPHQADSDAETTANIFISCLNRINDTPILTLRRIIEILDPNAVPLIADLSDWLRAIMTEREQKALVAESEQTPKAFRGFQMALQEWGIEDPIEIEQRANELPDQFEQLLPLIKSNIAESFDAYEERTAQYEMMAAVANALEVDSHLLVEAGTGTGKSLAYLLPAAFSSAKNKQKVVISTHTINLQEQLRQRDLPMLANLFPQPIQSAVLKGRSHYLCLRKFEGKINGRQFEWNRDEFVTAAQMVVWLGQTKNGEDDDLHLAGRNRDFWKSVASDADSCLNRACPWFKRCFYHRARHQATNADLIITNHAMVFTDMLVEHPILPAYSQLVVDEAHHFEEVAINHLGTNVNYYSGIQALQDVYSNAKSGTIPSLLEVISNDFDKFSETTIDLLQQGVGEVISLKEKWENWFENIYGITMERIERNAQEPSLTLRLLQNQPPKHWEETTKAIHQWTEECMSLVERLDKVIREVKDKSEDYISQSIVTDAYGNMIALRELINKVQKFCMLSDDEYVYWMEASVNYRSKSLQLNMAPIDVSSILRESIFESKASVVMTSATLSVGQKFDYFIDQLGLDTSQTSNRLNTLQLTSPFDYRNNVLMTIPKDFPVVKGLSGEQEFIDKLVASLADVAVTLHGRMLVLFTSNKMLRQVHEPLKDRLASKGIQVYGQGVESNNRTKLTKLFMDSSASVLLGTSSFWEGVDIPGEALSCLAIVRLPFQPPNHPLVEARCDLLKAKGQNPFMTYSLPQAVLKFKQGFGRLIRTSTDRGIVIVYDRRVVDTYYGKYFLYSLPGPKIEAMNESFMVDRIQEWFYVNESKEVQR